MAQGVAPTPRTDRKSLGHYSKGNDCLRTLVFFLFFLSGFLALVYEVGWVRAMSLEFGGTSLAVSTVLAVFMGGLALGAWLAGRFAARMRRPVVTYGYIEAIIAVYAMLTPWLFPLVFRQVEGMGVAVADSMLGLSLFRFVVATVLILPPSLLMGATLPILARLYVWKEGEGQSSPGLLYGVNTLGAFAGTLTAGFVLLPALGLQSTMAHAAVCNLILALLSVVIGSARSLTIPVDNIEKAGKGIEKDTIEKDSAPEDGEKQRIGHVLLAVALTGAAAMVCEVVWTRVLVLQLGASVYAFTIMLSTFLAGLGFGAAVVALVLYAVPRVSHVVFHVMALASALALCLSSLVFPYLPEVFLDLYHRYKMALHPEAVLPVQFLLAALVMLVPAAIMGGLLPVALRVVIGGGRDAARKVGTLYAWNTIGSILGSVAAGFLLIPHVGIRGAVMLAACMQCAGGVAIMSAASAKTRFYAVFSGLIVVVLIPCITPAWNQQLMSSAIYKYAKAYDPEGKLIDKLEKDEKLLFYKDGLTSTITVLRRKGRGDLYICANGKIDGSSRFDMATQRLSVHVPILFHEAPTDVCVLGMGTGCSAGSAALHDDVDSVTVLEIEAAMVEGARLLKRHNHNVHKNPKVDIRITDGRLFLRLHPDSFDVIASEPSNPWQAGSSSLFTAEFFELAARALHKDGVFCQWVQIYGMSPENTKTIVRTFASVFPHVYLLSTIDQVDLLLLGSQSPLKLDLKTAGNRMAQPSVARDLADKRVGIGSLDELLKRFRMGPSEVAKFAGEGALHTDDLPVIAYRAPRDLYKKTGKNNEREIKRFAREFNIDEYTEEDDPKMDVDSKF